MCFKDDWEKKTHGLPQNIKMNTVYQTPTWYSWWVLIPWQKTASKKFTEKKTQNPGGGRWKDLIDLIAQLHSGNLKKQDWLEMSPDIEEAISTCFMHSCVNLVILRHVKMTGWYNHQRLYRSKMKLKSSAKGDPSEPPENVQNCQLTIPPPSKKSSAHQVCRVSTTRWYM